MHPTVGLALALIVGSLAVSKPGWAQPAPGYDRPQGWVEGSLTWNADVVEEGVKIHRQGRCSFHLEFRPDGSYATNLAYRLEDITYPYSGQKQVETIAGREPGPRNFLGTPQVRPNPRGGYDVWYPNPTYQVPSKIQRYTWFDGRWTEADARRGPKFFVHCAANSFTAYNLEGGTIPSMTVATVFVQELAKQIPQANGTFKWSFRTPTQQGSCPPGTIPDPVLRQLWCRQPPGSLRLEAGRGGSAGNRLSETCPDAARPSRRVG